MVDAYNMRLEQRALSQNWPKGHQCNFDQRADFDHSCADLKHVDRTVTAVKTWNNVVKED